VEQLSQALPYFHQHWTHCVGLAMNTFAFLKLSLCESPFLNSSVWVWLSAASSGVDVYRMNTLQFSMIKLVQAYFDDFNSQTWFYILIFNNLICTCRSLICSHIWVFCFVLFGEAILSRIVYFTYFLVLLSFDFFEEMLLSGFLLFWVCTLGWMHLLLVALNKSVF